MQYFIDVGYEKKNTAGTKAPEDIVELCKKSGMKGFFMPKFPADKNSVYQKVWLFFICSSYWRKLKRVVKSGDVVLYQHPMYGIRVALRFIPQIQKKKKCKFIAVIHDIETLRKGIEGVVSTKNSKTRELGDNELLKTFDAIICHNKQMKRYLINQGFEENRLVCLEIFDYLARGKVYRHSRGKNPSIAIAGNLAIGKCAYIYDIFGSDEDKNSGLEVHLYGNNFDEAHVSKNVTYHGSFPPEELPEHLEGDFGLVWDGPTAATCEGNTGEYLKYNNPHKTSLYLASNLPVIVWSQAAISDFVLEHKVGIAVDNLDGLDYVIANISDRDYKAMCENVFEIGEKIREGYYFTKALNKCIEIVENS